MAPMKPIHPFPARMAPEAISNWLDELPARSRVLDPMCGSGVVLKQAACRGHEAIGVDADPLAVLMSRVWLSSVETEQLVETARGIVAKARRSRAKHTSLPHVRRCHETQQFLEYWFAEPQRSHLARLATQLFDLRDQSPILCQILALCFSRIIVTKQSGASLAWDTSHSRPHKVKETNDYDVYAGFVSSASIVAERLKGSCSAEAKVYRGDCRSLTSLDIGLVDAVITSPPYLNAIDYLRGHKLSLAWMGYAIPDLRTLRAKSVGTERSGGTRHLERLHFDGIEEVVPRINELPRRQQAIVSKYAEDAQQSLRQMKAVLKPGGRLVLVLADSVVRGVEVRSSHLFSWLAQREGFTSISKKIREIPENKRYLPISSAGSALERRMRTESVEVFSLS